ncbi:MAG: hypothetical protein RBT74_11855 [Tenuifilaceae bacterium]|nr:hypothetical protein [Tenuifilaceae bacterium]
MYSNLKAIATDKLNIEQLKDYFKDKETFETSDIVNFFVQREPEIKTTTVNWRVYSLVQSGVLNRIGRGRFAIGKSRVYTPEISSTIKSVHSKLKKQFPYLRMCVWNTSALNEFMIHQPGRFYVLIEVDKAAAQSVFYYLKEQKFSVFIEPTKDLVDKYLLDKKETLIVKSLVSEAPLQTINTITSPTIEKMLVDIFCDDIIFAAQQGSEMRAIFQEALNKYTVNVSRMMRYADRRRKKEIFREYLNSISSLRQHS